ncbi:MAG: hypothetical protein NTV07_07350 [Candidatus Omnitrophica bacterium]|nr:hypothetical protein [Candidatus Omnitrophota bacterium]
MMDAVATRLTAAGVTDAVSRINLRTAIHLAAQKDNEGKPFTPEVAADFLHRETVMGRIGENLKEVHATINKDAKAPETTPVTKAQVQARLTSEGYAPETARAAADMMDAVATRLTAAGVTDAVSRINLRTAIHLAAQKDNEGKPFAADVVANILHNQAITDFTGATLAQLRANIGLPAAGAADIEACLRSGGVESETAKRAAQILTDVETKPSVSAVAGAISIRDALDIAGQKDKEGKFADVKIAATALEINTLLDKIPVLAGRIPSETLVNIAAQVGTKGGFSDTAKAAEYIGARVAINNPKAGFVSEKEQPVMKADGKTPELEKDGTPKVEIVTQRHEDVMMNAFRSGLSGIAAAYGTSVETILSVWAGREITPEITKNMVDIDSMLTPASKATDIGKLIAFAGNIDEKDRAYTTPKEAAIALAADVAVRNEGFLTQKPMALPEGLNIPKEMLERLGGSMQVQAVADEKVMPTLIDGSLTMVAEKYGTTPEAIVERLLGVDPQRTPTRSVEAAKPDDIGDIAKMANVAKNANKDIAMKLTLASLFEISSDIGKGKKFASPLDAVQMLNAEVAVNKAIETAGADTFNFDMTIEDIVKITKADEFKTDARHILIELGARFVKNNNKKARLLANAWREACEELSGDNSVTLGQIDRAAEEEYVKLLGERTANRLGRLAIIKNELTGFTDSWTGEERASVVDTIDRFLGEETEIAEVVISKPKASSLEEPCHARVAKITGANGKRMMLKYLDTTAGRASRQMLADMFVNGDIEKGQLKPELKGLLFLFRLSQGFVIGQQAADATAREYVTKNAANPEKLQKLYAGLTELYNKLLAAGYFPNRTEGSTENFLDSVGLMLNKDGSIKHIAIMDVSNLTNRQSDDQGKQQRGRIDESVASLKEKLEQDIGGIAGLTPEAKVLSGKAAQKVREFNEFVKAVEAGVAGSANTEAVTAVRSYNTIQNIKNCASEMLYNILAAKGVKADPIKLAEQMAQTLVETWDASAKSQLTQDGTVLISPKDMQNLVAKFYKADVESLDVLKKNGKALSGFVAAGNAVGLWVNGNHYVTVTAVAEKADGTKVYEVIEQDKSVMYVAEDTLMAAANEGMAIDKKHKGKQPQAFAIALNSAQGARADMADQIRGSANFPTFTESVDAAIVAGLVFKGISAEEVLKDPDAAVGMELPRIIGPEQLPVPRAGIINPALPVFALSPAEQKQKEREIGKTITRSLVAGAVTGKPEYLPYMQETGKNISVIQAQALKDPNDQFNVRLYGYVKTIEKLKQDAKLDGDFVAVVTVNGPDETEKLTAALQAALGENYSNIITVVDISPVSPSESMADYVKKTLIARKVLGEKPINGMAFGFAAENAKAFVTEIKDMKPAGVRFAAICGEVADTKNNSFVEGCDIAMMLMTADVKAGTVVQIGGTKDDQNDPKNPLSELKNAGIHILPVITADQVTDSIDAFRKAAEAFATSM